MLFYSIVGKAVWLCCPQWSADSGEGLKERRDLWFWQPDTEGICFLSQIMFYSDRIIHV